MKSTYRILVQSTEENLYALVVAEIGHNIVEACAEQCGHPALTVISLKNIRTTKKVDTVVIDFFTGQRVA